MKQRVKKLRAARRAAGKKTPTKKEKKFIFAKRVRTVFVAAVVLSAAIIGFLAVMYFYPSNVTN